MMNFEMKNKLSAFISDDDLLRIAEKEEVTVAHLLDGISDGSIVVLKNKNHRIAPLAI